MLTPVAILARFVFDLDETTLFVLAAVALDPARVADRRGDGARSRAHRPRRRRLPERELRQRAGADHRAVRRRRRVARRRARLADRLGRLEHPARPRRGDDRGRRRQGRRALAPLAALRRVRRGRAAHDPVGARLERRLAGSALALHPVDPDLRDPALRLPRDHVAEPAHPPRRRARGAVAARVVVQAVARRARRSQPPRRRSSPRSSCTRSATSARRSA